ncbi:MAG: rhodanese-like domain-containing protein [Chloroflexi bacterium]|nr:rhodanese-like domain-containing protein [Chloroflexota bacterium]
MAERVRNAAQRGRQEPGEPYRRISVDEAKAMLDEGDSLVVDVRNPDEWVSGHVQGAVHIPVDSVLSRADELPRDKNLLFICAVGVRSGLACEMAAALGFDRERLFNIEEGTPRWIEKKHPTTYGN